MPTLAYLVGDLSSRTRPRRSTREVTVDDLELRVVDMLFDEMAAGHQQPTDLIETMRARLASELHVEPDETVWCLFTAAGLGFEQLSDSGRGRESHEAAIVEADAAGHTNRASRSRLHVARILASTGDPASALDLITRVAAEGQPGSLPRDQHLAGLTNAALGALLRQLGAFTLAVSYLSDALELMGARQHQARIVVLFNLLDAAIGADRSAAAVDALAQLESTFELGSEDGEPEHTSLLPRARAAIALADGRPADALDLLGEMAPEPSLEPGRHLEPLPAHLLWVQALNELGRHDEVVEAVMGPSDDPGLVHDTELATELSRAHEASGRLREAYRFERRAYALRSERDLGMTALLPVVDDISASSSLSGRSKELAERSERQARVEERFNVLTVSMFDDLLSKLDTIDATIRRANRRLDESTRSKVSVLARDLTEAVDALDQRPRVAEVATLARADHILGRICRTLEPAAVQRQIRLATESGSASSPVDGWQRYSTWRAVVRRAIRTAPEGSTVRIAAIGADVAVTVTPPGAAAG